jgi:hypothetical protein
MGDPTTFVIRIDTDELARWRKAAEQVAEETRAAPNISALIRRAMDAELKRLAGEKKGGRR